LNGSWNEIFANTVRQLAYDSFTGAKWEEMFIETSRGALTNGVLPYSFKDQEFNGYVNHNWYGRNQHVSWHAADSATAQMRHSFAFQFESVYNQANALMAAAGVSQARLVGLEAQRDWASRNRNFLRERTIVARRYQDLKMQEASLADGVLNHSKRLPGLRQRFEDDIVSALFKLQAVRKGFEQVYGYMPAFPAPDSIDYLDQIVGWTRTAIQWLITFADRDQSVAFPISLRELVGEDKWVQGAGTGVWTFSLPPVFFGEDLAHLRMRGVSIVTVPRHDIERKCGNVSRIYRFVLTPPGQGHSRHRSGTVVDIDQSLLSPVILARVSSRDDRREPDVLGASALHNACPCGDWTVKLAGGLPSSGLRADFLVDLADIQIDLHMAYSRVDLQ
jgi:hypothetical protein